MKIMTRKQINETESYLSPQAPGIRRIVRGAADGPAQGTLTAQTKETTSSQRLATTLAHVKWLYNCLGIYKSYKSKKGIFRPRWFTREFHQMFKELILF